MSYDNATIIGGASKSSSTIPCGVGTQCVNTEATGTVAFTASNVSINYTSQAAATVFVSKINMAPNVTTGIQSTDLFTSQYWVLHRYGTGSFNANANVSFDLAEDLTTADQSSPSHIYLYSRGMGTDGNWDFVALANSVDAVNNRAVFNAITAFDKQFMICRNTGPTIITSTTSLAFTNIKLGSTYQQLSYTLSGVNLSSNLTLSASAGFSISTNASTGFASTLSLTPVSGMVSQTIYVRFTPTTLGSYTGTISNNSTGANAIIVNIPSFDVNSVPTDASQMMNFNGTNQYLQVSNFNWNPASVFTVEWWINPYTLSSYNQTVGNGWGNRYFHLNSDGSFSCGVANNANSRINSAAGAYMLNEWQHFAYVLNLTDAKLYRNGELVGELTNSTGYNTTWTNFNIGSGDANTINGQMDEFRIWSTARTQDDIRNNMYKVLKGNETGLKLYLPFNETTGNVVEDYSGNAYQVLCFNSPTRSSSTAPIPYTSVASGNWSSIGTWNTAQKAPIKDWACVKIAHDLNLDQLQTLNSLEIASTGSLTINTGQQLNLASTATITLRSDANETATLIDNGTLNPSTATINAEQYLTNNRNWNIASPLSLAQSGIINSNGGSLWNFVETTASLNSIVATNTAFTVAKGYVAKPATTGVVNFTGGVLNTGNQSIALTRTETGLTKRGFNLIGNPYPSFVNANTAINSATNVDKSLWYNTVNSAGTYVVDVVNTTSGEATNNNGAGKGSGILAPMQSAWARVATGSTSGTITFNNSMRSLNLASNQLRAPQVASALKPMLNLQVSNGINTDESIIIFDTNATNGYDVYDSPKMSNENAAIPEIYTLTGTQQLAINSLNNLTTNMELPLGFTTGTAGSFGIKATQAINFDPSIRIILKDLLLGTENDITSGNSYNFTTGITTTNSRFSIKFGTSIVTEKESKPVINTISMTTNANQQFVFTASENCPDGMVIINDVLGMKLQQFAINHGSKVTSKAFGEGVYVVMTHLAGKTSTQKVVMH